MLQEREPVGTIEIDHAEQKVIVDHGGHCFLERAGTDERISAGSEEVSQATIHPRSVRTTRASVFFVTSAFICCCRVQIVRKGAKDRGNARPLGTKLLDLPAEMLVVPLQRGHQALSCSCCWAASANRSTSRWVFSNQRAISALSFEAKGRVLARWAHGPGRAAEVSSRVGDRVVPVLNHPGQGAIKTVKVTPAQAIPPPSSPSLFHLFKPLITRALPIPGKKSEPGRKVWTATPLVRT